MTAPSHYLKLCWFSWVKSRGIYLTASSQELLKIHILDMSLEITNWRFHAISLRCQLVYSVLISDETGTHLNNRCRFTNIEIPIMKIRQSHDRFIFMIEIPIPGKTAFIYWDRVRILPTSWRGPVPVQQGYQGENHRALSCRSRPAGPCWCDDMSGLSSTGFRIPSPQLDLYSVTLC